MKKLFSLAIFIMGAAVSIAQTMSFTLTTPPCNHNGVLTVNVTGLTPPLTVTYITLGTPMTTITHVGVSGLTDVLTGYSGGPVGVTAVDGSGGTTGSDFYSGTPPFNYVIIPTNAICPGLGSDSLRVFGGTPPYTYQWFDEATFTYVGTTDSILLPPGRYGVTITDAGGCVYGSMDQPDTATIYSIPTYSITTSTTSANCTNGSASVSVSSGAVFPLSYSWSTGATTPSIVGLVTGTYNVSVTDAIGCSGSSYAVVPQLVAITCPIVTTPATCIAHDGAVISFGSGGLPPYSYIWSNGATTQSQTGLAGGYYTVAVTDANGCIGSDYATVGTSTPITATYSTTPSLCASPTGTATLSISGGTAPFSTMWYTTPLQTGTTAVSVAQGDYAFKITDAVGCERTGTATIPPIDVIAATFISAPSICTLSTGSMNVTASGGATPYSFLWSNGATTATISSVPSDVYHVTITDALGCTAKYSEYLPFLSTLGFGFVSTPATCIFNPDGVLSAVPYGGTAPYHYAWTGGGSTSTIIGLPGGVPYWAIVTDALGCSVTDSTTLGYDTLSNCFCTISGVAYFDMNGNCIRDAGEPGIQNLKINISGRGYTFTDTGGHYSYKVPAGTYNVSETVKAFYPLSSCQPANVSVTSVPGFSCNLPVDFANSLDTIHDLHVCTWDYNTAVPGHVYFQTTIVTNNGTIPEPVVFSSYTTDGQFYAPTSIVPATYYNGSANYYNTVDSFPLINPGSSRSFIMNFNVPTNIPIGTSVVFKDTVTADTPATNWLLDYSPSNNVRYFTTNVAGPMDPNFKEVYPKGSGAIGLITYADSVLEYMVHFQNVGNYQAENIRVLDTLDDNLDWTTLSPIFMSAPGQVTVNQVGSRKVATFMFSNINLPPAISQPVTSNGMFTYSIKTKSGLPLGTQFKNSASIYFDYNAPVRTNQTLNTLGSSPEHTVNNTTSTIDNFTIYPNPANNTFNVVINSNAAGNAYMTVTDISGKTMINKMVSVVAGKQTLSVNASQLAPGVYLVNMNQDGKVQTQKLVIIKS